MKISKLFHWLYCAVMMLPIFIIPIFAIFTRNENYNSNIALQIKQNKVVDFNQYIQNPNFENNSVWYLSSNELGTMSYSNDSLVYTLLSTNYGYQNGVAQLLNVNPIGDIMYIKVVAKSTRANSRIGGDIGNIGLTFEPFNAANVYQTFKIRLTASNNSRFYLCSRDGFEVGDSWTLKYVNYYNLTQMFGRGNEPSIELFDLWYQDVSYSFTLSDIQLLKNYDTLTYNDNDVASQYLYTMYNGVDKYFNFDNVFNFGTLYDWLQLNFFNGNAPLGFFIFWHLLIYWLLTSLLWLLFDVLMYVPNLIHRWLDKASVS